MLAGVQERLGPLQAWLFPQRVYLELQDQAITAMVLDGRRLTWLDQLTLQPGIAQIGMDQIGVLQHAALTGPLIQGAHQRLIVGGPSGASPQEENQARE